MILLDTNIVSEVIKPTGDANVRHWLDSYAEADFFIATPIIAELRFGLALLPEGRKKDALTRACDEIENEIVRPTWKDARAHFALNCASLGCPPIGREAYEPDSLEAQLDQNCRRALADPRWLALDGNVARLTKLFDWYEGDFEQWAGGVRAFVAKYGPAGSTEAMRNERIEIKFIDYDWSLNEAR